MSDNFKPEVDRVHDLIVALKEQRSVRYLDNVEGRNLWKVSFRGEPSFRHINRISMFRDFLDSLLPGGLVTAGGERGSVVVMFAPHDVAPDDFEKASLDLSESPDVFREVAQFLGISSLEYGGHKLDF